MALKEQFKNQPIKLGIMNKIRFRDERSEEPES